MSGLSLETSLRLSQTLSPQMIQSLKLLQYSNLQLEQVLRKELQENPILEETQEEDRSDDTSDTPEIPEYGPGSSASDDEEKGGGDEPAAVSSSSKEADYDESPPAVEPAKQMEEVDWKDYQYETFTPAVGRGSDDDEEKVELYDRINLTSETLEEHLLNQLHEKKLTERQMDIAEFLVGNLDDKGYISVPLDDMAAKFNVSSTEIQEVRHVLLRLDPLGVGAMDLRECLLVQIQVKGLSGTLMARIVEHHFELLKKYQLPELAKKTGAPVAEVQLAIREIGRLEPYPGTLIGTTRTMSITPDLVVNKLENGEFQITLNDGNVPTMRVSREYMDMLRKDRRKSADVRKYVSEKLNAASWLIRAIEQRKVTMIKVMTSIVEKQREWFEKGPPNIRPLRLQEVADDIGMHISTVCRVTNDKYVQTPFGVYELKQFFSSGVEQEDGSEVSTQRARDLLKELVDGESKKKPLSDQQLVDIMKEKGIEVARRTVSKYREQLGVLPARLRKEF